MEEMIICPECGKGFKNIVIHLFYKHGLNLEEFKEKYPDFGRTQVIQAPREKKFCPYCNNGILYTPTGLGTHISYIHKGTHYGSAVADRDKTKKGYTCPICNRVCKNLSQHIELTHHLAWEEFVGKYNWQLDKAYFSEEHKQTLSENKVKFYGTDRGLEWRKQNSERISGDGNYAKLQVVREKISKAKQGVLAENSFIGRGILIMFMYNGKKYTCRSLMEFLVTWELLEHKIDFLYEKKNFFYQDEQGVRRLYKSDFCIGDIIYELKSYTTHSIMHGLYTEYEKYQRVTKVVNAAGFFFCVVNYDMMMDELNIGRKKEPYYAEIIRGLLDSGDIVKINYKDYGRKGRGFLKKYDLEHYGQVQTWELIDGKHRMATN